MRHPKSHVIQAEFAEGGVEIHFQTRSLGRKRWKDLCIGGSRTDKLGVITARLLLRGAQGQIQSLSIENWWFGIGHRQDHGYAARQSSLGGGIPIFLMGLPRFTYVDMRVN